MISNCTGRPVFLLDGDDAAPNIVIADNVADFDLDQIAAAQLAVDRQVKKGTISNPPILIQKEAYGPDLARIQRLFFTPALRPAFHTGRSRAA